MSQMKDFRDQSLKDSKFLIDLLNAILPGCVSYGFLAEGKNGFIFLSNLSSCWYFFFLKFIDEEIIANAKYAITVARKIGACVFITVWYFFLYFYFLTHLLAWGHHRGER